MEPDKYKLGERVKRARKKKKLSQMKLAQLVGLCRASIISIEKGRATRITYDKMGLLIKTLWGAGAH